MFKKRVNKTIFIFLAVVLVIAGTLCVAFLRTSDADILCSGVVDLGISSHDSSFITNIAVKYLYDTYKGGCCSAAVKTLDDGDTIVGRNLDMNLSNFPVYVGKTDIDGYYETIYASYIPDFGPEYNDCAEKGVPAYIQKIIPFIAFDSLNSEGLYIQTNMRMDQTDEDGNYVYACEHTNLDGETRISAIELPTYITLRCSNVSEAVELINNIDIYTLGGDVNWPFAYIIADAEGNCGLIELGCGEARFISEQNIQTNYYISEDFASIQKYKQGISRYSCIEEELDSVKSESGMRQLMSNVKYSGIYDVLNPFFDIRSEYAGDEEYLTNDYLDNDNNWNDFINTQQQELDYYYTLSEDEKKDSGIYWKTIYTSVVNCTEKTVAMNFFENYEEIFIFDFSLKKADSVIN